MSALTVSTSTKPQRLTKLWHLVDDKPTKVHAGEMVEGTATVVDLPTPQDMAAALGQLEQSQALIFGLPAAKHCAVTTSARLPNAAPGTIARTKDAFKWNAGPGWMLIDGDPLPGHEPLTRDEWLAMLFVVAPTLATAPMVWGVSSSSCIHNAATDEQVTAIRGQRLYVLVADARDIPRAGKALFERLWLAGHGCFIVSKSGQTLGRAPVDASVWQTNRLDFAAPPVCLTPLEARRPAPEAINNEAHPLVTAEALPDLTEEERQQLADIQAAERGGDDLLAEIHLAREEWIDERLSKLEGLPEPEQEEARQRLRDAVEHGRLFGDFELIHSSGRRLAVGDLLDNPDQWHGERFHDPLEPDYSNSDRRIALANLKSGGVPYIYSHAHGGKRYRLLRPVQQLKLQQGEMPQILPKIMERLEIDAEIFERGGRLMRLADGELLTVDKPWLQTYLEGAYRFLVFDGRSSAWEVRDCPDKVAARVMAARGAWGLPKVTGLVTFPVMRPDGSVIEKPGFDEATGLLYLSDSNSRPIPRPLDRAGLSETLRRIWEPFAQFPFDGDTSRGVFLAALLTTVCRPALPTAPGFLIRAYTAGTGKTLLSECLMMLVGAPVKAMPLPENNSEEIGKRLFSVLLTGRPGAILDNLTGVIDSADLCVMLTSAEPEGRILGQSEIRSAVNRVLWVLNGNNVSAGGDTFRRILPITLDADCESPETRKFTFNPRNLIRENLDAYRADLLSVLLTFQWEGGQAVASGGLGSFDEWESLVRQCVCWLIREDVTPAGMADPAQVLALSKSEDPHHQQHIEVLQAWWDLYGDSAVQVREIEKLVSDGDFGKTKAETAFIESVRDIAPPRAGFSSRYFAGWLRRHKGRVVAGMRLDSGDQSRKEPGWRVSMRF
tara:strand:+ start:2504 stop:5179 length:2676 start_codon:yes stop_codon:yes gene_type:complete